MSCRDAHIAEVLRDKQLRRPDQLRRRHINNRVAAPYAGPFAASVSGSAEFTMAEGDVYGGTQTWRFSEESIAIPSELTVGIAYLVCQQYSKRFLFNETLVHYLSVLDSRPDRVELLEVDGLDRWVYSFVVAKCSVVDGVLSSGTLIQEQYGSHGVEGCLV